MKIEPNPMIKWVIMSLLSHLQFLESKMASIRHVPTLFEYYAAIQLSKQHHIRFYGYQDIPDRHKKDAGFPIRDQGIDLIDETFQTIVQVKYYRKDAMLHYGMLSTFLGTPLLVGRKHLRLLLVRTDHSCLTSEIQSIVRRGDMTDVRLCSKTFLQTLKIH